MGIKNSLVPVVKVLGGGKLKNSACMRVESVAPVKPARASFVQLYGCPRRVSGCEVKSAQARGRIRVPRHSSLDGFTHDCSHPATNPVAFGKKKAPPSRPLPSPPTPDH